MSGWPRWPGWRRRVTSTPGGGSRTRCGAGAGSTDPAIRLRAARALERAGCRTTGPLPPALLEDDDVAVRVRGARLGAGWRPVRRRAGRRARSATRASLGAAAGRSSGSGTPSPGDGASCSRRRDRRRRRSSCAWYARPSRRRRRRGTRSFDDTSTHRDRELGLVVMERIAAPGPASDATAAALDGVLADDVRHAARILAALVALRSTTTTRSRPMRRCAAPSTTSSTSSAGA